MKTFKELLIVVFSAIVLAGPILSAWSPSNLAEDCQDQIQEPSSIAFGVMSDSVDCDLEEVPSLRMVPVLVCLSDDSEIARQWIYFEKSEFERIGYRVLVCPPSMHSEPFGFVVQNVYGKPVKFAGYLTPTTLKGR
jgi:hypothetical protein